GQCRLMADGGVYASPEDRPPLPAPFELQPRGGRLMAIAMQCTKIAIALVTTFAVSQASAQSANSTDEEIAALKRQLRLLEEKLDRLEKQTVANTSAAKAKAEPKVSVANAYATIPVKVPAPPPGAIVTMPNNRPTICTADGQNCISLTSRLHFDAGGYKYRPHNTHTQPQRLHDRGNARRARLGGRWEIFCVVGFSPLYVLARPF